MISIVGVSFKSLKSLLFLSPNGLKLQKNDVVVAETENGLQIGIVKSNTYQEKEVNVNLPLKNVLRIASKVDIDRRNKNEIDSLDALKNAKKISKELNLDMNFIDASFNFDRSQLLFSFLSDARVDFRELAKKLAQRYKTRIELRQIGVRDKAKKIGGIGPCGLFLCCNSFLNDFNSVSINMAKNQFLALNPSKINGVCGRLLCCLEYENETYSFLKKDFPRVGNIAETSMGTGKVVCVDIFKRTYKADIKDKGVVEFTNEVENGSFK